MRFFENKEKEMKPSKVLKIHPKATLHRLIVTKLNARLDDEFKARTEVLAFSFDLTSFDQS